METWDKYFSENKKDNPDAGKQATKGAQNRKVSSIGDISEQLKRTWLNMTTDSNDKPREGQ